MGVSAQLEVDAEPFGLLQMVRLVVQKDGVHPLGSLPCELLQRTAGGVGAVVATDDAKRAVYHRARIDEQMDAGLLVESPGPWHTTVVFVVAQTGIDGRLEPSELLGHAVGKERTDAVIDDVACDEDEVGMLGIDEVHPVGELPAPVVVAKVQVAHHDNFVVLCQGLLRREREGNAHLVVMLDVAPHQEHGHADTDAQGCCPVRP